MLAQAWSALSEPSSPASERRGPERHNVMIPAAILCDGGDILPCVIRDLSEGGARIGVSHRHRLPATFKIAVNGRDVIFPVTRVWRRGNLVGIQLQISEG